MADHNKADRIILWGAASFGTVLLAFLAWSGRAQIGQGNDIAVLKTQMTAVVQAQHDNKATLEKIEDKIETGNLDRYTASTAAMDRKAILESAASDRAALMAAAQNNSDWNRKQDEAIKALELWRAHMEGKQP